jgi:hypothetical protein
MNYAFGLTRIGLRDYVLASFVCMAPGALAYTYLGYAGREAVARQAGAIRKAVLALASSCAAHERQGTCPMHQRHQHPRGSHECCQTAACSDSSEIRSDTDSPATTN